MWTGYNVLSDLHLRYSSTICRWTGLCSNPMQLTWLNCLHQARINDLTRRACTAVFLLKYRGLSIFPAVTILWVLSFCVTCAGHFPPNYTQDAKHCAILTAHYWRPLLIGPTRMTWQMNPHAIHDILMSSNFRQSSLNRASLVFKFIALKRFKGVLHLLLQI